MSDSKYSALPPAATLTGAEIFAVAQAGNSVRTTVSAVQNNALGTYTAPGIGAVAQTVAAKLAQTVSVMDFGAKGDGSTNDTAAFAAATATGQTIYVPYTASFYVVTALTPSQDALLWGPGIIKMAGVVQPISPPPFLYPQSAAETAASVTPTFYFYQPLNAARYGADPAASAATNTTAISNAAAVGAVNGGAISVNVGTFSMNASGVTLAQGVKLFGAGKNATYLSGTGTTGTLLAIGTGVALNEVEIANLTIQYASAQTAGAAIKVMNGHQIHLHNLRINAPFVGIDWNGGAAQLFYLADHVEILSFVSVGIQVGNDGTLVQDLFMSDIAIGGTVGQATGFGVLLQNVSGYYFSRMSILTCGVGFRANPGVAGYQVTAGLCDQILCDTCVGNGFEFVNSGGAAAYLTDSTFSNCWSASNGTGLASAGTENGIWISPLSGPIDGLTFDCWRIINNKGAGIQLDGGLNISITNPQIFCNSQVGSAVRSGIEIAASTSSFSILGGFIGKGGRIGQVTGVNNQKYGIQVAAGVSNNYIIDSVNVRGNVTGGILDGGTGTSRYVSRNLGYNPIASTAITIGASPFTWQNNTGDTVTVVINGGTVSAVTLAGIQIAAATTLSASVPQAQSLVVTYSVVPTQMNYVGT